MDASVASTELGNGNAKPETGTKQIVAVVLLTTVRKVEQTISNFYITRNVQ